MIRGLLVVERRALLAFAVVGVALFTAVAVHVGFSEIFVFPDARYTRDLIWVWVIAAGGMGLFLGSWDAIFRTQEYASLRPVRAGTRFLVRAAGGLAVAAAWLVVPLIWIAVFNKGELPGDYMGLGMEQVAWGTVLFTSTALGLFLANLPLSWLLRGVLGAALAAILCWLVITYAERRSTRIDPTTWAVGNLCVTALLLHAALWANGCLRDADRPLWVRAYWPIALGCLAVVLVADAGLRTWVRIPNMDYPRIAVLTEPGSSDDSAADSVAADAAPQFVLTRNAQGEQGSWRTWETDRHGQIQRPIDNVEHLDFDLREYFAGLNHNFRHTNSRQSNSWRTTRAILAQGEGKVTIFSRERVNDRMTQIAAGKTSEQLPFSAKATLCQMVSTRFSDDSAMPVVVGEPGESQLWFLNKTAVPAEFEPVPLPDGDVFLQWSTRHTAPTAEGQLRRSEDLVVGRDHRYRLDTTERTLVQLPPVRAPITHQFRVHRLGADPINPQLEVRDTLGTPVFNVTFSPSSASQWFRATTMCMQSLLRAPALQTTRWFMDASVVPVYYAGPQTLVQGRNYTWLLALNWALALGLAWFARRRLLRMGANFSRANTWALAIAACGIVLLPLYLMLESKRRWQRLETVDSLEHREPLIRSA